MAIYKRGKTWWTDFSVNGQRYRESLDTRDWRAAQAREKELIVQASQGKIVQSSQKFARLPFSEAADRYIADRLPHLSESSIRTERERLKPLRVYFAAVTLIHISSEVIRAYVARRKQAGISNRTVNLETGVLRRILKRAKLWQRVADDIEPLPERHDVGRATSNEEKVRLTKAADSKPEWQIARLAMELALNTTMRACEIRGLVWRDIDFLERSVTVRRSKTEAGERVIPLNANAWAAILELRERAKDLSGENISPDWFLFPHAEGFTRPDPNRPMRSWRTAWRRITKAAGLVGFRFHDLRHHAITELAESRASEQTIMAIAGHVSARMLSHYSHVRFDARRNALDALVSKSSAGGVAAGEGSHVTNNVTNEANASLGGEQLIENMVDVTGIEPATPCLQRLVARRINELDGRRRITTECYKFSTHRGLRTMREHWVALSRVWWWAQNWAQFTYPVYREFHSKAIVSIVEKQNLQNVITLLEMQIESLVGLGVPVLPPEYGWSHCTRSFEFRES